MIKPNIASGFMLIALLAMTSSVCSEPSYAGRNSQKVALNKALIIAINQDDTKKACSFIKLGADVNTKDVNGEPVLILAADNGNDKIISCLLGYGASIDARGTKASTALITATAHEHTSTVKLLLSKGADPKLRDSWSETALMWATLNPFAEGPIAATVKVLVSGRADVNATDKNGSTPLMNAELYNHSVIMKLLLDVGANVNTATANGTTTLIQAAEDGNVQITKLLLSRNANVSLRNNAGKTALDLANEDGNTSVARLLSAVKTDAATASNIPVQRQTPAVTPRAAIPPIDIDSLPSPIREEMAAVHIGMTRAEFDKHFWHFPGLGSYFDNATYFCHALNDTVAITVDFKAFDPAAKAAGLAKEIKYHGIYWPSEPGQEVYEGNPRDTIVKVTGPWKVKPVSKTP